MRTNTANMLHVILFPLLHSWRGFLVLFFFLLKEVASLPKYQVPGSYCVDLGGSNTYLEKGVAPLLLGFNLWRKAIKLPLPLYGCLEGVPMSALSSFVINQIIRVIFPACCAAGDTKPMPLLTEVFGQPSILQRILSARCLIPAWCC